MNGITSRFLLEKRWCRIGGIIAISSGLAFSQVSYAQEDSVQEKPKITFIDTLDHKIDLSDWILNAHGFVPVANIITESSLGGFGGLIAPIFISPKKYTAKTYVPPDITILAGAYTTNQSWGGLIKRIGSFPKQGIKYKVGAIYGELNLDFYRDIPLFGERKFSFEIKGSPVFLDVTKRIWQTDIYAGLSYTYAKNRVTPAFEEALPYFVKQEDLNSQISALGGVVELDKRNSIFTPDKGHKLELKYNLNGYWTGSDYTFQSAYLSWIGFKPITTRWVLGVRAEGQFVSGDPPFYLMPSINMRGVPMARYQGNQTYLMETEQRYDFTPRWSVVAFAGVAKAPDDKVSFAQAKTIYSYGGGFRYLLARIFKLRVGVDIAHSNDDFGYYIVFGHSWNR